MESVEEFSYCQNWPLYVQAAIGDNAAHLSHD